NAEDAKKILGANLVLTGEVERQKDTMSVRWTVADIASQRQLRLGTISVKSSEPQELEGRTIESIIRSLGIDLKPAEREAVLVRDTGIEAAKDAYVRGRGYLQEYDKAENIAHAIALLEQARTLDANYARAYAALGEAYWRKYELTKASEWIDTSQKSCQKALSLNGKLAAAHGCLGTVYFGTGRYEE